jgi:hypothetical protein
LSEAVPVVTAALPSLPEQVERLIASGFTPTYLRVLDWAKEDLASFGTIRT